jgi:hypothetical protein
MKAQHKILENLFLAEYNRNPKFFADINFKTVTNDLKKILNAIFFNQTPTAITEIKVIANEKNNIEISYKEYNSDVYIGITFIPNADTQIFIHKFMNDRNQKYQMLNGKINEIKCI